jgi:hypothetical protein
LNNFSVSSHINAVLLCPSCHVAYDDLLSPGFTFFPEDLDYFFDFEHQDRQKRLADPSRRREVPTAEMYAEHMRNQGQISEGEHGLYVRYQMAEYLTEDFQPVKGWHGAPLAAIRRAWSAIGSLFDDSIPKERRGRLLDLLELYRTPVNQQGPSGPGDITNPAPAEPGNDDDGTQGGEGGNGKRPMPDPPQLKRPKQPRREPREGSRRSSRISDQMKSSNRKYANRTEIEQWLTGLEEHTEIDLPWTPVSLHRN